MKGFTSRYSFPFLAYYESTTDVHAAIAREKQINAWRREKKIALIKTTNPQWRDLSRDWIAATGEDPSSSRLRRDRDSG